MFENENEEVREVSFAKLDQMDLETENEIAKILMREAAELRRQAEKEGVRAYLERPTVRGRPNSRFLTATVRGVQQSNRVVEINEMWRVRQKELELDNKLQQQSRGESSSWRNRDRSASPRSTRHKEPDNHTATALPTSNKRGIEECCSSEDGSLKDEEVEEFLQSRVKRGRGAVGSRMDETGPYLPPSDSKGKPLACPDIRMREDWEHHVLGPEKPSSVKSWKPSENDTDQGSWKKSKKDDSVSSKKYHSKKHKSKDRSRDKKKDKKSKHRSKSKN